MNLRYHVPSSTLCSSHISSNFHCSYNGHYDKFGLIDLMLDYARKKTNHVLLYLACEHIVFEVKQLQRNIKLDNP